jgi:predicted SAM-dependent methyltransferase
MINLHLGCGKLKLPDFINVDIQSEIADMKFDINDLSVFNNNTVDQIYMCHTLEHIRRHKILALFLEWNRVIKLDGKLRIAVPDFEKVVKIYNKNHNLSELLGLINGGQRDDYDIHFVNFDFDTLKELLESCGFTNVERYNQDEFLGDNDDYSKCYLPHMDKENGELMSLNVLCTKSNDVNINNVKLSENMKKYLKYN